MSQQGRHDDDGFTFGSVMVGRSNHEPPSEIEIKLRSLSQKLRVVERKNLNGAHLMIQKSPQVPMTRCLAVRIYYPEDVTRIDESLTNAARPSNAEDINKLVELLHDVETKPNAKDDDVDGLKTFRDKFHSTVVICVIPPGSFKYFDRPDSFVHRLQQTMGSGGSENGKMSWVNFVPDASTALRALAAIVGSFSPEKRGKKAAYFASQRENYFIPDESGVVSKPEKAAEFAATALSEWAHSYGLPEGEEGVLISTLGTLGAIVTASSARMDQLPVERTTRAILHQFFGTGEGAVDNNFRAPGQNFVAGHVPSAVPPAIEIMGGGDQLSMTQQMRPFSTRRPLQPSNPTGRAYPSAAGFTNPHSQAMDYTLDPNFLPRPNLPPTAAGANEGFSYRQHHPAPRDMYGQTTSMPPSSDLYGHEPPMMMAGEHYDVSGGAYQDPGMMPPPMAYQPQQRPFVSQRHPTQSRDYSGFHYSQPSYEGGFQAPQHPQHGVPPPHYSAMHGGFHQQVPPRQLQTPQHLQQPPMASNPRSGPFSNKNFRPVRRFH